MHPRAPARHAACPAARFRRHARGIQPRSGRAGADAKTQRLLLVANRPQPGVRSASSAAAVSTTCGARTRLARSRLLAGSARPGDRSGRRAHAQHPIWRTRARTSKPCRPRCSALARRVPHLLHRGQRAPASPCTCAATCRRSSRLRPKRASNALAAPWIADGHVRRLEGNAVVEYLPEHQRPQGRGDELDPRQCRSEISASRRGWHTSATTLRTRTPFARSTAASACSSACADLRPHYKLDGIADVDRLLEMAGHGGTMILRHA